MERRLAAIMVADMAGYSRLMEQDESGVLERQKTHRRQVIDPEIDRSGGRVVKTTGDGMLVEFASARDAVRCAVDIQYGMARREADQDPDTRIQYRIGINIGDVIFDDGDIFGDGVNVAARLETLAEPGGVCISDIVQQTVTDGLNEDFRDLGSQRVKNISRPVRVWQWTTDPPERRETPELSRFQRVRYCASGDGTQIAWATIGNGLPVLRAPHWLNHIEYEWDNPLTGPMIEAWAAHSEFTRFDQRGNGLSDRNPKQFSVDAIVDDMEAVVDAAGLDRFAIYAASQGASNAVAYAQRHPEKVSCIVFLGGYLRGALNRDNADNETLYRAGRQMIEAGWGAGNPVYRKFFTSMFFPDSGPDIQGSFDELQRLSCDQHDILRLYDMLGQVDMTEAACTLNVPALVVHARGDKRAPVEEGRIIARAIPGAEFVELPGDNHILVAGTPDFDQFFDAALPFIRRHA